VPPAWRRCGAGRTGGSDAYVRSSSERQAGPIGFDSTTYGLKASVNRAAGSSAALTGLRYEPFWPFDFVFY